MNKLPSERIYEKVMGRDWEEKDSEYLQRQISAIKDYLDEEWENKQIIKEDVLICKECGLSGEISGGVCWSSECKGK